MDFVEGVGRRLNMADSGYRFLTVGNKSLNGNENNFLFRNRGGDPLDFADVAYVAGADCIEDSRGVAVLDIEADGDQDLIVQTVEGPSLLLVNQGTDGNWLQVRARGTRSNRDAIGARIEVKLGERVLTREVTTSSGYISGQSLVCHFGLGDAETIDELVVHWPSGAVTRERDVAINQRVELVEPEHASAVKASFRRQ